METLILKGYYKNKKCVVCGTNDKNIEYILTKGNSRKKNRRFEGFMCDKCFEKFLYNMSKEVIGE